MILTSVLLPAPFSPSNAWIWLRPTVRSTASLARHPGNCLVIPVSCSSGAFIQAGPLKICLERLALALRGSGKPAEVTRRDKPQEICPGLPKQRCFDRSRIFPSPPFRGRGRGPARSAGRVRWVSASALASPTSPQPSPPLGGGERANGAGPRFVYQSRNPCL